MKNTREKLFFGYIGASAVLSILTVIISALGRVDWYYYMVTPVYLYEQLLLTGIALVEWGQLAFAILPLCACVLGVLLRWKGATRWSLFLIFTPLIVHTLMQIPVIWMMTMSQRLSMLPYLLSFALNCILLCVYWFGIRKK